jgi:hypothetical protein
VKRITLSRMSLVHAEDCVRETVLA